MEKQRSYVCNKCGKIICKKEEILKADLFIAEKSWGYFSEKDGETHRFCLCESCYDSLVESFLYPAEIEKKLELL